MLNDKFGGQPIFVNFPPIRSRKLQMYESIVMQGRPIALGDSPANPHLL